MRRLAASIAFLCALSAAAVQLTAVQNGDHKRRYEVSVEGTNCWMRALVGGGAAVRREALPEARPE